MKEYPLQYASTDKNKKSHYNVEWKRQGKPTWCGEQERPTQLQNQDMLIIQSQKTTEYSREPKQKQANRAQVTEFTEYQGRVKNSKNKTRWPI